MAGGVDNKWIIRIFLASAAFDGILVGNINQMSWNWRDVVTKCSLRILGGKGVSSRGHSPFAAQCTYSRPFPAILRSSALPPRSVDYGGYYFWLFTRVRREERESAVHTARVALYLRSSC